MENKQDQKTQQIGQNPVSQPVQIPEKLKINYWKISTVALLFLLVLFFIILKIKSYNLAKNNPLNTSKHTVTETPNPLPTNSSETQPTIPTTQESPTIGKSYGVFYPFSEGITINNNLPIIIGKVPQGSDVYLATKFGIEKTPVSGGDEYFLRFIPGRTKNFKIKIDGVEIVNVYGTPQYPTVLCKNIKLNPDGTSLYDPKTGIKSPPDDIFKTESDCFVNKKSEIPPLVFFAKTETPLSNGKHTLTLEGKGTFRAMTFSVNLDYHLPVQNIFVVDKSSEYYYYNQYSLIHGDICGEGYYYDTNYLKIPIPSFNNPNLYYGISFPQSKVELGNINKRRIQISFENERFDLFFPQSSIYYEGKSFTDVNNLLSPYHELFLPEDHLVFTDGRKASYVDAYTIIPSDGNYAQGYFEVYPVDITGGVYRNSSIPWVISGSSSCDG